METREIEEFQSPAPSTIPLVKDITNKSKKKARVNQQTFPLKVTLFLSYGAVSAILPYLTIHMQDLGISIEEVAIIYAVLPITSFVGPLMLGGLADRLGNYKSVLILSAIGAGIGHTLLLLVPFYQANVPVKEDALIRWTPVLEKGILVPVKQTNFCQGFNDALVVSMPFSAINCQSAEINYTYPQHQPQLHQATLYFMLEQKLNCSALLVEVDAPWTYLQPDSNMNEEFVCKSNLTYLTGENANIGNNSITFWIYFILRIISTIFLVSFLSLMDATTLAVVKRCGEAEYGRERIWSILGSAVVSPIAGVLVDRLSQYLGYTNYTPAFLLCDFFIICSIVSFRYVEMEVDKANSGILRNGLQLIKYSEVVVFLFMIFILGNLWGFVESYLFIFLKELQAPNFLLGLTLTVGSLVGIPFLWGAERIVNKFGRVNLIIAAFLTYFVRFLGYSYMEDPYWCFPFEAMEAFTVHLMWAAAATYCSLLAPKGLLASLMSVMGSLHYSLGKGVGSFLGGIAYGAIGARLAFRYFGIAAGLGGIIFYLIDYFWVRGVVEERLKTELSHVEEDRYGKEISFNRQTAVTRRPSIFDANPFSQTTAMISLGQIEEDDNEIAKDIMDTPPLHNNDTRV